LQTNDTYTLTKTYQKKNSTNDFRNSLFEVNNSPKYNQVFESKCDFIVNLSIIDLLFNKGPESSDYLHNLDFSI